MAEPLLRGHGCLQNTTNPKARAGEALIRVAKAGICATDLQLIAGYAGFQGILGHEFVGIVESADDRTWVGQRVVGSINLGCRSCPACNSGQEAHCPHRRVLGIRGHDGVFAPYAVLPQPNLLPVPDSLSDEEAVFTEPLAAALRISEQLTLPPSAELAVLGPRQIGPANRPKSLELPQKLGLDVGLASEAADSSCDLVVEATGNAAGLESALRLVRPGGTLVLKSTFANPGSTDLSPIVVQEIRVVGSRCGPFAPALRLLERGAVQVRPLIDADYPLTQGLEALSHAARQSTRKILLSP
nr:2-deoxy-scyllo-inosamine dehydrogenase-like [Nerophis lumbriciformis]